MTQKKEKRTLLELEINGIIFFSSATISREFKEEAFKENNWFFWIRERKKDLIRRSQNMAEDCFSLLWNLEYLYDNTR